VNVKAPTSAQWLIFNPASNLQVSFPAASSVPGTEWDITTIGVSELSCIAGSGDFIGVAGAGGFVSSVVLSSPLESVTIRAFGSNALIVM